MSPRKVTFSLIATTLALLALGAGPAAAKEPCWKTLFKDYSLDGRVDKTYPVHCYRDAVANLQEDISIYGPAADDINRALQAAIRNIHTKGGKVERNTLIPGQNKDGGNGPGNGKKHDEGFFGWLASAVGPSSADSIPLPLLILAGLGLLLVAAAAASFAARRIQARRVRPAPAPTPPQRRP